MTRRLAIPYLSLFVAVGCRTHKRAVPSGTYVVTAACAGKTRPACVSDNGAVSYPCVDSCPVDAIHPTPREKTKPRSLPANMVFIDPSSCIQCSACQPACPVSAILRESQLSPALAKYAEINAAYFR